VAHSLHWPRVGKQAARRRPTRHLTAQSLLDGVNGDRREGQVGCRPLLRVGQVTLRKRFRFHCQRKEESIAREAVLDGVYVIRSNMPEEELSAEDSVHWQNRLSQVERASRSLKTVDLQVGSGSFASAVLT